MRHARQRSRGGQHPILWMVAAIAFVLAGVNHFLNPGFYVRIVPPGFPGPPLLVKVSGVAEIAGGLGLLVRPLRRAAGWGLIALLVAVFPANVYMAMAPQKTPTSFPSPPWTRWARLPLQGVMVWWVWNAAGLGGRKRDSDSAEQETANSVVSKEVGT